MNTGGDAMEGIEELGNPLEEYLLVQAPVVPSPAPQRRKSKYGAVRQSHDKENHRITAGEVFPAEGRERGMWKDLGNVAFSDGRDSDMPRDKQNRKSRRKRSSFLLSLHVGRLLMCHPLAPPLDFSDQKARNRRSAFMPNIGSPTSSTSPTGEVKGWFSNLFNWRHQMYILGSFETVVATREEMHRLLEQMGVHVTPEHGVLRCQLDELRFRVDFALGSALSSSGLNSNTPTSPRAAQFNALVNGAYVACAACLHHEKGPATAYRVIWRQVRNLWQLDNGHAQSMMSPAMEPEDLPIYVEM
jgi:hypothetical protein